MEVQMTEGELREKAMTISSERILTQQDFEQLKVLELKKRVQDRRRNRSEPTAPTDSKKRKTISIDTDSDSEEEKIAKSDQKFVVSSHSSSFER